MTNNIWPWISYFLIILTSLSIFSSFAIYKRIEKKWYGDYIKLIVVLSLFYLVQSFFYLISYNYRLISILSGIRLSILSLIFVFITYFYCSLSYTIFGQQLPFRKALLIVPLCTNVMAVAVLVLFHNNGVFNFINVPLAVLTFIIDVKFIVNYKFLFANTRERMIIFFLYGSVLLKSFHYIMFFANYLSGGEGIKIDTSPAYVLYYAAFHAINLIYNVSTRPGNQSEFEDIPAGFTVRYSITDREKEVILYILKGFNSRDISTYLHCSPRTIDTHIYNIYHKCKVNNRVELVNQISEFK